MTNPICKTHLRFALLWTLAGLLTVWLFERQTDEMARVLTLTFALACLAGTGLMLWLARETRTPVSNPLDTRPLETSDTLPPHPSRHLVDTTLVAILEATRRAESRQARP